MLQLVHVPTGIKLQTTPKHHPGIRPTHQITNKPERNDARSYPQHEKQPTYNRMMRKHGSTETCNLKKYSKSSQTRQISVDIRSQPGTIAHHSLRQASNKLQSRDFRPTADDDTMATMGRGRVDFNTGIQRLAYYAKYHGTANPKSDAIWLTWRVGIWVRNLRVKYRTGKLTRHQVQAAEATGVNFTPPYRSSLRESKPIKIAREQRELQRIEQLRGYYKQHGHINVKQLDGVEDWTGAGRWIARLRIKYRNGKLSLNTINAAEQLNITWNIQSHD